MKSLRHVFLGSAGGWWGLRAWDGGWWGKMVEFDERLLAT